MLELKNRLMRELQQDIQVEVKHRAIWNVPVQLLKIDFATVHQTKMDVLMKMLLIAFQTSSIQKVDQLSEILLVESIFIQHIVQRMIQAGLIQKDDIYQLTSKGTNQLEAEVFIDQYEEKTETLLYSPCHHQFYQHNIDEEANDEYEDYRFYDQYADWEVEALNKSDMQAILQEMQSSDEQENVQIIVEKIHTIVPQTFEVMPCIEFELYNKEKDVFYVRVWNAFLQEWDETLEKQIQQYDRDN